ncbi:hypothetical protein B9Z55_012527 [Caenorhabditis nigoni]|nr:hypothetical protein B9Z55_012527 [Caenorhabditis nigoni]
MDKDMKAAKSGEDPSNQRYAPKPVPATERAATQSLSYEFRQDIKQEIEDQAPPVPVNDVVHSQQPLVSPKQEDLVDAPTRDDQAQQKDVIDEYLASKNSFESYFGKNEKHITKSYCQKMIDVMNVCLAGEISFENLPCQIKLLEVEFRTGSHLTKQDRIERLREVGVEEDVMFEYFKQRRSMDEKWKAATLRDTAEELTTEAMDRQQTQKAENPEDLVDEEHYDMQEDESIPSHGALPDWDFVFAQMRQKAED